MKTILCVLLLALLAVVVSGQTPSKPTFPKNFDASVLVHRSDERHPSFFRWYWDEKLRKDKFDGLHMWMGELYYAEIIFDHPNSRQWNLFFQEESVTCVAHKINATMPHPSFENVRYIGKALIDYVPVYHWISEDRDRRITYQVYDTQDKRELKRFDVFDHRSGRAESWTIHDMNVAPQDPTLFGIPAPILAQCNIISEEY